MWVRLSETARLSLLLQLQFELALKDSTAKVASSPNLQASQQKVCQYWAAGRVCKFGDECRFAHTNSTEDGEGAGGERPDEAQCPEVQAGGAVGEGGELTERIGDLLHCTEQYIVHQTNCVTKRAAGLAKALFQVFPHADCYKGRTEHGQPGALRIFHDLNVEWYTIVYI